jgi:hypothetical protein
MIKSISGIISKRKDLTEPINYGGSMFFSGTSTSNLLITNDIDFRMGVGDFTIEWWQYQTDNNSFPRIFAIGNFPSTSIGVSIESTIFYFWSNGSPISFGSVGTFKNMWVHFAITRNSNTLRVFKNGNQLNSTTNSFNFNNTVTNLRIGNETNVSSSASFGGYITNFHWIKGFTKYTSNFTSPTEPFQPLLDTKLLLRATDNTTLNVDSSDLNKIITNNNVSWNYLNPFIG